MPRIDVVSEIKGKAIVPRLTDKRLLFCVTGSVAAYRMVDVVRELIRQGADVHLMMSESATQLVGKYTYEWATGNPVITEITGQIEHVLFVGDHEEKVDAVIIGPSTANTISKIAHGISDTPVTLTATTAIGNNIPIILIPGMHRTMWNNPIIKENIDKLKSFKGIKFIMPVLEEGKAKVPSTESIINEIIRLLSPNDLLGKSVLITGGATREYIDQVRFISNPASGKTALALAYECWYRGAEVVLIAGNMPKNQVPFDVVQVTSTDDMLEKVISQLKEKKPELVILSAAVSDYTPATTLSDKIRSGKEELQVILKPTPKIIEHIKKTNKSSLLISFKAEYHPTTKSLKEIFKKYQEKYAIDIMVANDIAEQGYGFATDENHIWLIEEDNVTVYIVHK